MFCCNALECADEKLTFRNYPFATVGSRASMLQSSCPNILNALCPWKCPSITLSLKWFLMPQSHCRPEQENQESLCLVIPGLKSSLFSGHLFLWTLLFHGTENALVPVVSVLCHGNRLNPHGMQGLHSTIGCSLPGPESEQ